MRRIALLALVALVFSMCRRGGTTSPPGPPGGGSTGLLYTADVRFFAQNGTLTVILQFLRISRGDTVLMDRVWVEGDTLTDIGTGEYVWRGPYRDSLALGFEKGSVGLDTTLTVQPIAPPVWLRPGQDTTLHSGDPFTAQVSVPARPFRLVITDAYNTVRIVDTLLSDTVFPLPDTILANPATYLLFAEAWDTLHVDSVDAFQLVLRGGGVSDPRQITILSGPSSFTLVVEATDPDPTDTIPVTPSWPVIRWTPDTFGVDRLWVVQMVGGAENRIFWDVSGLWDSVGNVIPFRPPVYYGRYRSDYVADSSLGTPPDSLTPGDTFLIRVERNNQVLDSVLYVP